MTTLALAAGMLALVVAKGVGAGFNRAMAVVVGGQTRSLVLTLVAAPVMHSLFGDAVVLVRRFLSKGRTPEQTGLALERVSAHAAGEGDITGHAAAE